ncbi:RES family NAD+ phosphorylase [Bauldia sp.]|uniref:RES family NAD+ phosphorylase n=1 Tax=Bauldia sp. TaxID=2575872 RepID=UPI003BA9EC89
MNEKGGRRDRDLLDAIETVAPVRFAGRVWRLAREGREPINCSRSGGRWDDGTFDVLYTSAERDGAIAEIEFHLSRGQPVFPTRVRHHVYELDVTLDTALKLADLPALGRIGLDTARFGQLSYQDRAAEYPRSQDIAEAAFFLEFDGLIVPSARWPCDNIVLFCERVPATAMSVAHHHGPVDWAAWRTKHNR